jgi:F420-dependent oxidoreductase-like protein
MTVGVALSAAGDDNYVDLMVARAREAAAAGLRSTWFAQRFDYDAAALAALVGREVPEVSVGTSVVPIFARHPLLVASQAQTAQAATHGRFRLGLGLSAKPAVESAFGIPYDRPIARLREFLIAVNSLLDNGSAEFRGELLTAVLPSGGRTPGAAPRVPVLVAAMGPQALRVAGGYADGILPYLAGPRALGEHLVPAVTAAAEAAGRPKPQVVAIVAGVVTSDVDAVRDTAARQMAFFDQVPSYRRVVELERADRAADVAVIGDEETVAAQVRRYFDAGATEVVFTQTNMAGEAGRLRTWQLLGELATR